jgi:cell division septum initiation protein DivIVA
MDLTSEEVAATRFTGTRYVYNRREVDTFVRRVSTTLLDYERELARAAARMAALEHALDVAHTARTSRARASSERRRALDQAIRVAGAPRPPGSTPAAWEDVASGAWEAWRETMEAEYAAAAALAMAREDARRMRGCAAALAVEIEGAAGADAVHLLAAAESVAVASGSDDRPEAGAAAAGSEVADAEARATEILEGAEREAALATEEATAVLDKAEVAAQMLTGAAEQEAAALARRLAQLRTAVRQAEDYYREVAPDAADRAAMAGDLIDLELSGLEGLDEFGTGEELPAEVNPVEAAAEESSATEPSEADDPALVDAPREPDFYRRRLAGLRQRLEQTITSD